METTKKLLILLTISFQCSYNGVHGLPSLASPSKQDSQVCYKY